MPDQLAATARRTAALSRPTLGDRVRQLRISQGLTQTELAGDRFSKEYVSQIERGKTRPTGETVEWLAARLAVDSSFLETGVSSSARARVESVISRAEAANESSEFQQVVAGLDEVRAALPGLALPELEYRAALAEGWARMSLGDVRQGVAVLTKARQLA